MTGEEGAGAADAGLDFVEDEEGVVLLAEALDGGEVAGGWGHNACFALEGFEDYGGGAVVAEDGLEGGNVAEGDFVGFGEHGAEALFPEGVAHEG